MASPFASRFPINPTRKTGVVILDAQIHSTLNTKASNAYNPLWPLAQGIDLECYKKTSNGSIAFTLMDSDPAINALLNNSLVNRGDAFNNNKQVGAIDCLNGLGDGERSNWAFASKIVVLGIVEQGGVNDYFNVIRRGILSVMNNGDETINNGDDVYAYPPTMDELENSGLKTRELANGVARLWFRPLDRNKHAVAPEALMHCMEAIVTKNEAELRSYMPPYKRLCESLMEGACDLSVVMVGAVGRARLTEILDRTDDEPALLRGLVKEMKSDAFRRNLPGYLFPRQSQDAQWLEEGKGAKSDLNKIQAQAFARFTRACKDVVEDMERLYVGRAFSMSLPGMPLLLQVRKG